MTIGRAASKELFGYIPERFHPEQTIVSSFTDALVVCWDLSDSTKHVVKDGGTPSACWEAQSFALQVIGGMVRDFPPDIALPTGDGFLWVYDLGRFGRRGEVPYKEILRAIQPMLARLVEYQDWRAEDRPLTDADGILLVDGAVRMIGPTKLEGRFGVAMGMVDVHDCGSRKSGHWIAPVGLPLFLASRLCSLAPVGGLLIDAAALPDGLDPTRRGCPSLR